MNRTAFFRSLLRSCLLTGFCAAFAGCGVSDGLARYDVSGSVTHRGKPVPAGYIRFLPDALQGNGGPAVRAEIRGGQFATPRGKGLVGGPHKIVIVGYDGAAFADDTEQMRHDLGKPLFGEYATEFDFPRQWTRHDFAIP